jgi:hypothetical protein
MILVGAKMKAFMNPSNLCGKLLNALIEIFKRATREQIIINLSYTYS